MKNVKRILALVLCFVMILSLTACGTGTVSTVTASGTLTVTEGKADPAASDYSNDIDGLVSYLKDCELIAGDATDMSADFIGAVKGKQFCFTYSDATVTVELYEYDLENLSEKASSYLASAKGGKIEVLGKEVAVTLSESGEFMMIHSIDKESEVFTAYADELKNNFSLFIGK